MHGDQIEFIRRIEGVSSIEARDRLAAQVGMETRPSPRPNGNGAHKGDVWQPMAPPAGAPKPTERQLQCDMLHEYFDTGDRLLCYVRRFEAKGDKVSAPAVGLWTAERQARLAQQGT